MKAKRDAKRKKVAEERAAKKKREEEEKVKKLVAEKLKQTTLVKVKKELGVATDNSKVRTSLSKVFFLPVY